MEKKDKGLLALSALGITSIVTYYSICKIADEMIEIAFLRKDRDHKQEYIDYFDRLGMENLCLKNRDGLKLNGYYINNLQSSKYTLIMIHGHHATYLELKNVVESFLEKGDCDIFLPDLQGHGTSEGNGVGFGYLDAFDLQEWIDFLVSKNPGKPIVVLGFSMGGATVCQLSSKVLPKEVKCLIEDCGYDSLYNQVKNVMFDRNKIPLSLVSCVLNRKLKKRVGYTLKDVVPVNEVAKAKLPMMFIHGLKDTYVNSSMVFNLYNACISEKELFYVKDAKHEQSFHDNPKEYVETIKSFVERYI